MNQADHPVKASIKNILYLCLISIAFSQASPAKAQITPDNTLGAEASQLNQNVLINGALGDKINGGATRGSNLFHSFSEFNIKEGQRVYFANPTGIENILTRVTGGNASNIFGTLGVDGAANLFLINPSGILFGENALLDVQGSFVGTTANGVQFGNQGIFSATNPKAPELLTIQPSALWFNQLIQNAEIQNNSIAPAGIDSSGVSRFGLRVGDGKSLLLVGGNVSMDGGQLNALGGRVELGGLAEPGNINLVFNGDNLSLKFPLDVTRASVSLTNQAGVDVKAAGGGNIAINARNVEILGGSRLDAGIAESLGTPETVAGDITLNATGEIKVASSDSGIRNFVEQGAKGKGGNITIDSVDFSLSDGSVIAALTYGQGNAGNITVSARNAVDLADARIGSVVQPGGVGKGGNIDINAATLSLTDGSVIAASTYGQGNAGNVTVSAKNTVDLAGNAEIFSVVGARGVGKGGNININAATLSLTDGAELSTFTSSAVDTEPAGRGDAGNINILVSDLSLRDGAQINASTSGQGNAGNVRVSAKNAVDLANNARIFSGVGPEGVGKGGNIDINAAALSLTDDAQLATFTSASDTYAAGRGDAGNVNIKVAGAVSLRDSAQLTASTSGEGNAGNVTVNANAVDLAGNAGISSTVGAGGVGKGGNIDINAATLSLTDGAQLSTFTSGASDTYAAGRGDAGNVNIKVAGAVSLRDSAQFTASTSGEGNAGNVTVNANAVDLAGNAGIFSTVGAGGVGKGGNIDINAATLSLTDGAEVSTFTSTSGASDTQPAGRGDAGNVNVKVTGAVDIAGQKNGNSSGIRSSVGTGGVGNGGNIIINSGDFSLSDRAVLSASTFGVGNAGSVTVGAKNTVSLANAGIGSTVEAGGVGKGGNIEINAATLSLTDGAQLSTFISGASDTYAAGKGDAGNVNVKVTGAVDIAGEKNGIQSGIRSSVGTGGVGNGGNIIIDSGDFSLSDRAVLAASTLGQGNAGNVRVSAKDAVSLANAAIFSTVEAGGVGKGGNIDINAATLSLTDGAILNTFTNSAFDTRPAGRGDAGNVNVKVTGAVDIAGQSGILSAVNTGTVGNGGNITIDSGDFSLRDGAVLAASTLGQGNAGNITVSARNAVDLVNAPILSTVEAGGVGKGGNIDINAATLSLADGASLETLTNIAFDAQPAGRGDAGNVNILVTGAVDIAGEKNGIQSGIYSFVGTGTVGNGGNITIDSSSFSLRDGAALAASTLGQGNAGNVTVSARNAVDLADNAAILSTVEAGGIGKGGNIEINSPKITLDNQTELTAETASGNGGNINVNSDLLLLRRNSQISTSAGTEKLGGDGGNININSRFIVAPPNENSDISANAFTGTGGNIQINSQGIFGIESRTKLTQNSDITASSELGISGVTNINAPDNSSIQNSFTGLSPNVIDTNALIANSCISRGTKRQENSFTITGSGALRYSPGNGFVSAYTTGDVRSVEPTSRPWKKGDPIIEPTGLYRLPNGQLILSRSC